MEDFKENILFLKKTFEEEYCKQRVLNKRNKEKSGNEEDDLKALYQKWDFLLPLSI